MSQRSTGTSARTAAARKRTTKERPTFRTLDELFTAVREACAAGMGTGL